MQPQSETPTLVNVSADELAMLIAYRKCCPAHKHGAKWFLNASASNCVCHNPNLVVLASRTHA